MVLAMYVISKGDTDQPYRTYWGSNFPARKAVGELWEDLAVDELNNLGLSAYRPLQTFKKASMYTLHQRDILIKLDQVKRLTLEVKSRVSPFTYQSVFVSDILNYELKRFRVDAILVIDQLTGEARVAPGDSSEWLRIKGTKKLSYAIPLRLFSPLDCWVQAIKDGLYR